MSKRDIEFIEQMNLKDRLEFSGFYYMFKEEQRRKRRARIAIAVLGIILAAVYCFA